MCVIIVARKRLPNEDELRRAWSRNDDGAGVAWLSSKGQGGVGEGVNEAG
jgi:hypothetical protein